MPNSVKNSGGVLTSGKGNGKKKQEFAKIILIDYRDGE